MSHTSRSYQFAAGQRPRDAVERQGTVVKSGLHPDILVALEGEQVVDDGESRRRQPLPVAPASCRRSRSGRRAWCTADRSVP